MIPLAFKRLQASRYRKLMAPSGSKFVARELVPPLIRPYLLVYLVRRPHRGGPILKNHIKLLKGW